MRLKLRVLKISFIVLFFSLTGLCIWFVLPKSCVRKYPLEAKKEWKIICAESPFIENTIITEDIGKALRKVGFLCAGFPYPKAKEIITICDNEYTALLE